MFIFPHWSHSFQVCISEWSHQLQSKKTWLSLGNPGMKVKVKHTGGANSRNHLWFSFCVDISWPKYCFYLHLAKSEVTPKHSFIAALYVNDRHAASASPPPPHHGVPPSYSVTHSTCLNQDLHLYHMLLLPESWKAGLQLLLLSASNQILYFCSPLCPSKANKTFKMCVSK